MIALIRWRYRFITWFWDRPDALARRVNVENRLAAAAKSGAGLSAEECAQLAQQLGIPTWFSNRKEK